MGPSGVPLRQMAQRTPPCSGGRTRTLNNWTRTSRVADYTTPEWVEVQISRALPGRPFGPVTRGALKQALGRCEDAASGVPREASAGSEVRDMSRWSAYRCLAPASDLAAVVVSVFVVCAVLSGVLLAGPATPAGAAGTAGLSIKVTPNRDLVNGQAVTVSGRGLARTDDGDEPDLVRHRVHRRRTRAHEPDDRHAALRRDRRPGRPGRPQRDVLHQVPGPQRDRRRRLLRHPRPRQLRHRRRDGQGPGHRRQDQLRHPEQRRRRPPRPRPRAAEPHGPRAGLRRRAASPGG